MVINQLEVPEQSEFGLNVTIRIPFRSLTSFERLETIMLKIESDNGDVNKSFPFTRKEIQSGSKRNNAPKRAEPTSPQFIKVERVSLDEETTVTVEFANIPVGDYAISGEMKLGKVGIAFPAYSLTVVEPIYGAMNTPLQTETEHGY